MNADSNSPRTVSFTGSSITTYDQPLENCIALLVKQHFIYELSFISRDNVGEMVVFQWIEKIREVLQNMKSKSPEERKKKPAAVKELDLKLVNLLHQTFISISTFKVQRHMPSEQTEQLFETLLVKASHWSRKKQCHKQYSQRCRLMNNFRSSNHVLVALIIFVNFSSDFQRMQLDLCIIILISILELLIID